MLFFGIGMTRTSPRNELAQFLRSRRARVHLADVSLPDGGRRRTPGLRREEVARLADVGVSWYTWLEQGRDIHVSEPLLERLARALRLTPTERARGLESDTGVAARHDRGCPTELSFADNFARPRLRAVAGRNGGLSRRHDRKGKGRRKRQKSVNLSYVRDNHPSRYCDGK